MSVPIDVLILESLKMRTMRNINIFLSSEILSNDDKIDFLDKIQEIINEKYVEVLK